MGDVRFWADLLVRMTFSQLWRLVALTLLASRPALAREGGLLCLEETPPERIGRIEALHARLV